MKLYYFCLQVENAPGSLFLTQVFRDVPSREKYNSDNE